MSSDRVQFANSLRGIAALSVVIAHYFGVFWTYRPAVVSLTFTPMLPLDLHPVPEFVRLLNAGALFNWGAYGVALFFLISGFVIPLSLKKSTCLQFCVNRLFRLLPTYWAGFTLTLVAVWVGGLYFAQPWPFNGEEVSIHYFPGLRDLMNARSIDGIVWTLEVEMKFYFVGAVAIMWFRRQTTAVFLIPLILLGLAIGVSTRLDQVVQISADLYRWTALLMFAAQYISFMFIGVVFNYVHEGRLGLIKAAILVPALFSLFCLAWATGPYKEILVVAWSYGFALVTFLLAFLFRRLFRANVFFDFFADISYPLYVVHAVGGYVALRILLEMGSPNWLALPLVTASAIALSWVIHVAVERPSQNLGKSLSRRFSSPGPSKPGESPLVVRRAVAQLPEKSEPFDSISRCENTDR